MVILGLTGSIGMGKSNAASTFRSLRIPVHDADAEVHRLLGAGGAAVAAVDEAFPGVVVDGAVDRARLGRAVFGDDAALDRLEALLHPRVRAATRRFVARQLRAGRPLVVLDIPLLFETGGERRCDATMVVTAPPFVQAQRVLNRREMTPARLAAIRARQMPDAEKRRRADFVVNTGLSRGYTRGQIIRVVHALKGRRGQAWRCWMRRDDPGSHEAGAGHA
jgi:dephospho-CoA kinase